MVNIAFESERTGLQVDLQWRPHMLSLAEDAQAIPREDGHLNAALRSLTSTIDAHVIITHACTQSVLL
jgi:hypothetical protein